MKKIKWKPLAISTLVCLMPILLGAALYDTLPEQMAIHFTFQNQPDNFASKGVTVFGLPCMMALLQAFCCIVNDKNAAGREMGKRAEAAVKAVIPVVTLVIYTATIVYALGTAVDVRRVAMFLAGGILIVLGNYMPKGSIKNPETGEPSDRMKKANRVMGYLTVLLGVLFLASLFLPEIFSVAAVCLILPYAVAGILMGTRLKG